MSRLSEDREIREVLERFAKQTQIPYERLAAAVDMPPLPGFSTEAWEDAMAANARGLRPLPAEVKDEITRMLPRRPEQNGLAA